MLLEVLIKNLNAINKKWLKDGVNPVCRSQVKLEIDLNFTAIVARPTHSCIAALQERFGVP